MVSPQKIRQVRSGNRGVCSSRKLIGLPGILLEVVGALGGGGLVGLVRIGADGGGQEGPLLRGRRSSSRRDRQTRPDADFPPPQSPTKCTYGHGYGRAKQRHTARRRTFQARLSLLKVGYSAAADGWQSGAQPRARHVHLLVGLPARERFQRFGGFLLSGRRGGGWLGTCL